MGKTDLRSTRSYAGKARHRKSRNPRENTVSRGPIEFQGRTPAPRLSLARSQYISHRLCLLPGIRRGGPASMFLPPLCVGLTPRQPVPQKKPSKYQAPPKKRPARKLQASEKTAALWLQQDLGAPSAQPDKRAPTRPKTRRERSYPWRTFHCSEQGRKGSRDGFVRTESCA